MPALAFGIQFQSETDDVINVVHVLAACAITGTLQSVAGGQPLLIVGVAEPIVLVYKYMWVLKLDSADLSFTRSRGPEARLSLALRATRSSADLPGLTTPRTGTGWVRRCSWRGARGCASSRRYFCSCCR